MNQESSPAFYQQNQQSSVNISQQQHQNGINMLESELFNEGLVDPILKSKELLNQLKVSLQVNCFLKLFFTKRKIGI
jgi:hypothetical protein